MGNVSTLKLGAFRNLASSSVSLRNGATVDQLEGKKKSAWFEWARAIVSVEVLRKTDRRSDCSVTRRPSALRDPRGKILLCRFFYREFPRFRRSRGRATKNSTLLRATGYRFIDPDETEARSPNAEQRIPESRLCTIEPSAPEKRDPRAYGGRHSLSLPRSHTTRTIRGHLPRQPTARRNVTRRRTR